MGCNFRLYILYSLTCLTLGVLSDDQYRSLQLVQLIFRHGDKNPASTYPNDPYKNESLWPGGWNYITDKGKRRMYDLGIYFRQRYPTLLSQEYSQNEILATSTDNDRTIISASAFLTGLYRESNLQSQWTTELQWDPIPVRTLQKQYDRLLEVTEPCPRMNKLEKEVVLDSEFSKKFMSDNQEIVDYVAEHSGLTVINQFTVPLTVQGLQIQEEQGLQLPEWSKPVLESNLTGYLMLCHRELHKHKEWTYFRSVALAQKLITNMEDSIEGREQDLKKGKKMIVYSAHDRTVVDIMLALNIYHPDIKQPPPYGATLILELHRHENASYFIDVLYKNDSSVHPYKLSIPNCGSVCSIDAFKEAVSSFTQGFRSWDEECQLESQNVTVSLNGTTKAQANNENSHFSPLLLLICTIFVIGGIVTIVYRYI